MNPERSGTGVWAEYYRRYPNSHGFTELARVGFNSTRDHAVAYVGWSAGVVGGEGRIAYLVRQDGRWVEVQPLDGHRPSCLWES